MVHLDNISIFLVCCEIRNRFNIAGLGLATGQNYLVLLHFFSLWSLVHCFSHVFCLLFQGGFMCPHFPLNEFYDTMTIGPCDFRASYQKGGTFASCSGNSAWPA